MKKSSINGVAKEKQTYELKSTVVSNRSKARGCPWGRFFYRRFS
jgi:hypothetical protein